MGTNNCPCATSLNDALLRDEQVGVEINNKIKIIVIFFIFFPPTLVLKRDSPKGVSVCFVCGVLCE